MMKKQFQFIVWLALVVPIAIGIMFSLEGCGDDIKPDPCAKEKPVTADFFIYEAFSFTKELEDWKDLDTDTVNSDGVNFVAKEKGAIYEWTLGAETITTRSFYRENYPRGESIEVSLKVNKKPDKNCFPNDDGDDIKVRNFYTTKKSWCDSRLDGTYRGADDDAPTAIREITIEICAPNLTQPSLSESLRINNLTGGCDIFGFGIYQPGYTQLGFGSAGGGTPCLVPVGVARLDSINRNLVTIFYSRLESVNSFKRINKKFVGTRIK